jgi:beta-glucosidase
MKTPPLIRSCSLLLALILVPALAAQTPTTPPAATTAAKVAPDPSVGAPKTGNAHFFQLHDEFLARGKAGPIGLLFLGDSITERWSIAPYVWDHFYGRYQPANFGIGGDQTQHVIWRIEQGELDGIHPKVVVFMLGTNNTGANTAAQIAAADRKIIGMIRAKLPETRILLLAIFPRGPRTSRGVDDGWQAHMAIIRAVNADLAKLDDGDHVRYLDITKAFLDDEGHIPHIIMPDQLHPNAAGYVLWAEAMNPLLTAMMR